MLNPLSDKINRQFRFLFHRFMFGRLGVATLLVIVVSPFVKGMTSLSLTCAVIMCHVRDSLAQWSLKKEHELKEVKMEETLR